MKRDLVQGEVNQFGLIANAMSYYEGGIQHGTTGLLYEGKPNAAIVTDEGKQSFERALKKATTITIPQGQEEAFAEALLDKSGGIYNAILEVINRLKQPSHTENLGNRLGSELQGYLGEINSDTIPMPDTLTPELKSIISWSLKASLMSTLASVSSFKEQVIEVQELSDPHGINQVMSGLQNLKYANMAQAVLTASGIVKES